MVFTPDKQASRLTGKNFTGQADFFSAGLPSMKI
jgi:hypothetical protein